PVERYTGGNPLFILETVRHLQETGQLERGWPGRLPPPGKVGTLIGRRLDCLSRPALNLAQAAAILRRDFTFEQLSEMLSLSPLDALPAWEELARAGLMTGEQFSHDLILETVRAGILDPMSRWLNRRAAEVLQAQDANPARTAQHWLDAGESAKAVPWLLAAGQREDNLGSFANALRLLAQAAEHAEPGEQRQNALVAQTKPLIAVGKLEEAQAIIQAVLSEGTPTPARVKALDSQQTLCMLQGRFTEGLEFAEEGWRLAERLGDAHNACKLRIGCGVFLDRLGQYEEARDVIEPLIPTLQAQPPSFDKYLILSTFALLLADLGRPEESWPLHREAVEGARALGGAILRAVTAGNQLVAYLPDGPIPEDVLQAAHEAYNLGWYVASGPLALNLGQAHRALGRPDLAVTYLETAGQRSLDTSVAATAWARLALVRAQLGQDPGEAVTRALELPNGLQLPLCRLSVARAALTHGTPEQVRAGREILGALDPNSLPRRYRPGYEEVRALAGESN
ncbi:MAG TPA: hypothetical protein VHN99_06470, partial [Deinococcales bacterium]|nr:hypothetical protein [Deinococcales bacterium]